MQHTTTRRSGLVPALLALLTSLALVATATPTTAAGDAVAVIVRGLPGAGDAVARAVATVSGTVTRELGIIDGVVATVPSTRVETLRNAPGVHSVTHDQRIEILGKPADGSGGNTGKTGSTGCVQVSKCVPTTQSLTSVKTTSYVIGAAESWDRGYTGAGIDVALIDTGVTEVAGLDAPGKVIDGPDLSFDGQDPTWAHRDGYGHGTHLAGIIAGRDAAVVDGQESTSAAAPDVFVGVAPDARIVDVKVGDRNGVVDVSQVIAGIDWVVQNRTADGKNIRVLNLAFGTNGTQSYLVDPLTYAVEVAWRKGIVVVASAGNSGHQSGKLVNPAYDPHIIAVGATDPKGTPSPENDRIPAWSSRGDGERNPDIVAPGVSVESLVAPGSKADLEHASAKVGTRLIKGSGTSQSAAVVSGSVALYLEANPQATPDQVKHALKTTAADLPEAGDRAQGEGVIQIGAAISARVPSARQAQQLFPYATGTGLLEPARGDSHVVAPDGTVLEGEITVLGSTWAGSTWAGSTWAGSTWAGSTWAGSTWAGSTWAGSTWAGSTWAGSTWAGSTWAGSTWAGEGWQGVRWE